MGFFQLLRELDATAKEQASEVAVLAEGSRKNFDELLESAWERSDEPGFIHKLFEQLAEVNSGLNLSRERILAAVDMSDEEFRALVEEGLGGAEPLLVSMLYTDQKQEAARLLSEVYEHFDRPLTQTLGTFAQEDALVGFFALLCLSISRFDEDRTLAAKLRRKSKLSTDLMQTLRIRTALAGVASEDEWLVEQLTQAAEDARQAPEQAVKNGYARHLRREENSPVADLCMAVGKRKLTDAVEPLVGLLYTYDALEALDALAEIGDASALEAVRSYRSALCGRWYETLPFRLAADNALAAMGEEVSIESAREAFEKLYPQRYGYPKSEHCVEHWRRAIAGYADRGSKEELAVACQFVAAPWKSVRNAAAKAWEKLHGEPPKIEYWDETRIRQVANSDSNKALMSALKNPCAAFRHLLVEHLLKHGEPNLQKETARWCASWLESRTNFYVDGLYLLPHDVKSIVQALSDCDEEVQEALRDTSSAWLQAFVLGGEGIEKPPLYSPAENSPPVEIEVLGTAPFVYGKHINAVATSPDGTKLAVAGHDFVRIDNLETGEEHAHLELRWNWAYDCAFSPNGAHLAVGFHGGHVEIFDTETGKLAMDELKGHRGVPNGVRRLAYSPDGKWLVTVGQDARVICWNAETGEQRWLYQAPAGSYEAVTWTPKGNQVIASHVKTDGGEKNFLSVHDAATGEATIHEIKYSIWALRFSPNGRRLAMGGEGHEAYFCDPKTFEPKRELTMTRTTRLEFSPDGEFLYGCSEDGMLKRWKTKSRSKKGDVLAERLGALWGLDVDREGIARTIGTSGDMHTFAEGEPLQPVGVHVHTKKIKGLAQWGNELFTVGWDGQLLRWPIEGGKAEQVIAALDNRINSMVMTGTGAAALATGSGMRVVDLKTGKVLDKTDGDLDAVAIDANGNIAFDTRKILNIQEGDSVLSVTVGTDSISCLASLPDGGWLAGTDEGELTLVRDGERVWTIADHGVDILQFGAPHKAICDIAVTADGFITAGNDNTIRVYHWDRGNSRPHLRLRIHTYTGIFNGIGVSPNEKLLAAPSDGSLQVYNLHDGSTALSLPTSQFFGQNSLTVPYFLDDATIFVGTNTGRFFRVTIGGSQ